MVKTTVVSPCLLLFVAETTTFGRLLAREVVSIATAVAREEQQDAKDASCVRANVLVVGGRVPGVMGRGLLVLAAIFTTRFK